MNFAYQVNIDFCKCYKNTCDMKIFQTAVKKPDISTIPNPAVYAHGLFAPMKDQNSFATARGCAKMDNGG
jgi:hypothetical protein